MIYSWHYGLYIKTLDVSFSIICILVFKTVNITYVSYVLLFIHYHFIPLHITVLLLLNFSYCVLGNVF